jgi:pyruvate dehydrogenase E1 component beta subunit
VIDLRTIRPLDYKTIIDSVKKTNRLVIVAEDHPFGGVASEIAFMVQKEAFDYLDAPVRRVCQADVPMAFSPVLIEASLPSVEKIIKIVKETLYI